MTKQIVLGLAVAALAGTHASAGEADPIVDRQETVEAIIDAATVRNNAYARLEALCDDIGPRLSGSQALEDAISWAVAHLEEDGHENVGREPVMVPRWVRGEESAWMTSPRVAELPILGLGGSVGTPPEGIEAEVVVVSDEEELETLGDAVAGKIVLFDNPMPPFDPEKGAGYGKTVRFRVNGARLAAAQGAVGCLIRSVTATSLRSPHTGVMRYGDAERRIPAAALTTEDAAMIHRFQRRGIPVTVKLSMGASDEGLVPSANVVAELRGSELPEEVVVIGGHLDSWDVGTGAHDDGAGCITAMEALSVLRRMNLRPRRTIRVVLWTNEENGLAGADAYAEAHADETHVAGIESDSGGFRPHTLSLQRLEGAEAARDRLAVLGEMLANVGIERTVVGGSGADLGPLEPTGALLIGLRTEGSRYFDYHHSHADTFDKIDEADLTRNVAAMAALAFVLADLPDPI